MLRAFKISSFEKTVLRKFPIFSISRITQTEDAGTGYRFTQDDNNPDQLFSRFSCTGATRKFSARTGELGLLNRDVGEKGVVTLNDSALPDNCEPPPEILENGEESLLKIDNLELLRDIANGDNEVFELLKSIQVKLDITACQFGLKMDVSREEWLEFLNNSPSKRKSFAVFLILNTLRELKKQFEKPPQIYDLPDNDDANYDEDDEEDSTAFHDVRCYHLFHNSLFLKLRQGTIKKINYSKALTAILYSSSIVFDCSYGDFMAGFEIKDLAKQLNTCASLNCKSEHPFHLMVCNFSKDDKLGTVLKKINPIIYTDEFPLTITKKSYLDIFPKSDLVYLTPHCNTILKNYDPNKTYIIGAFVDKTQKKPISLAKAKELKIPMAKLPIDQFLDWGTGDKCLSLPHVLSILLELRATNGNWHKAFQVIPRRFLVKNKGKCDKSGTTGFSIANLYDILDT